MFSHTLLASVLLLARLSLGYKQPFEYLEVLEGLAAAYADPASVLDGTLSTPLSVDVVGRVDATTTFVGQELNTEYLFGLFLQGSDENTTQLIGTPRSVTIQSSVVEPPVAAVSYISEMAFPTVNMTVPLQIDMFIAFDNDMRIVSYDAILRRVGEFMAYTVPYLAPQIAQELNATTTNVTELIELKTATDVCAVSTQYCTGDNRQYETHEVCWCRYIHKNMVKYRPEVHCPHIGPTGGDMCIDRDYAQVVDTNPFNQTLLAYNSSYNAADMKGIPTSNIAELVKVQTETVSMTTVAFFSVPAVLYMLFLYMMSKATEFFLGRLSAQYREMCFDNQRNTVTYVLDTLITGGVLILQLISSPILGDKYTFDNVNLLKSAALLISGLYIFELTYRPSMRWPLLIHHFCTIFAIVLLLSVLAYTGHPALIAAGEIWLFQATTEQTVFVGLFMYRLRAPLRWTRDMLRFGAVQSFIFKIGFAAYLLAFWAQKLEQFHSAGDDVALSVILVTIILLLMCTQIYGAWAVWCLARKVNTSMQHIQRPDPPSRSSTASTFIEGIDKVDV
ncbi:hypothetical protein HHX47_DHR1001763 [Lentinula edodes]|nr:hypothetical protein HHX47_DHR1001763 [Lentinula edodes]